MPWTLKEAPKEACTSRSRRSKLLEAGLRREAEQLLFR